MFVVFRERESWQAGLEAICQTFYTAHIEIQKLPGDCQVAFWTFDCSDV